MEKLTDIQTAFETFHEENPLVYTALVGLARKARERGKTRVGIGMLWEVLRWEMMMNTEDAKSDFKLNNTYRSRYVRLIIDTQPDLSELFETRQLQRP